MALVALERRPDPDHHRGKRMTKLDVLAEKLDALIEVLREKNPDFDEYRRSVLSAGKV